MMKQHRARKRFGQNFLQDTAIIQEIIHCIAPQPKDHIVEVGPGQAALTNQLLPRVQHLDAIEIDRDLVAYLKGHFRDEPRFSIHEADVLNVDLSTLQKGDTPIRLVGNLPYNIATPLLFHLFSYSHCIQDMMIMLQKEVVLRLVAPVGDHHYGRLSVMAQYFCDMNALLDIPPEAFSPQPKVDSAFLQLVPKAPSIAADCLDHFRTVVREAFNQRRKTLSNALKKMISPSELEDLGISPKQRPQELSVDDFVLISNTLSKK